MLGPVMDHARLKVDAAITHYLGRLFVLLPLGVACAFGVAAGYMVLAESVGPVQACLMMAGGFIALAFVVAMIALIQERNQRTLLRQAAQQSAVMTGLMTAAPMALAGGGGLLRLVGYKLPLLIGAVVVAASILGRDTDQPPPG